MYKTFNNNLINALIVIGILLIGVAFVVDDDFKFSLIILGCGILATSLIVLVGSKKVDKTKMPKEEVVESPRPTTIVDTNVEAMQSQTIASTLIDQDWRYVNAPKGFQFLLNTINCIRNKATENSDVRVRLDKFSSLIYALYVCEPQVISIRKEIDNIRTFCEFQRLFWRDNLNIHYKLPTTFHKTLIYSQSLLFILSDIFNKARGQFFIQCEIIEHIGQVEMQLTYSVRDGEDDITQSVSHDGFENIRNFLKKCYDDKFTFIIGRDMNGTTLSINIDVRQLKRENDNSQLQQADEKDEAETLPKAEG